MDPDLELRGGGGLDFLALLAFFPSVISSFFTQNKGGQVPWAPPLDPPLVAKAIADFGDKYGKGFYKRASQPHPTFLGVLPTSIYLYLSLNLSQCFTMGRELCAKMQAVTHVTSVQENKSLKILSLHDRLKQFYFLTAPL